MVCRSPANVSGLQSRKLSQEDNAFMGALKGKKQPTEQWEVILKVNSRPVKFHIDTGAEVTVVSTRTWQKIGKPSLSASDRTLRCPDEHTLKVKGMFKGTLRTSEHQTEQPVYVEDNLQTELLGRPSIGSLKLITQVAAVSTVKPVAQFPSLFTGLGRLEGDYTIRLHEGAKPYALSTPHRVAVPLLRHVKEELNHMEELGVITPVTEPTEWCVGMVVVPKPNNQVRICVDLTHLNENMQRERHPLPVVDQMLA